MPVPVGSARGGGRTSHPGAHTLDATPRHRPRHRRPPGVHHRRRASRTARTGASDSQGPGAGAQPQTARLQRPAPYTSRQCVACGSRETVLMRATVQCASCGTSHDRDHAAGANIRLRGMAAQAVL